VRDIECGPVHSRRIAGNDRIPAPMFTDTVDQPLRPWASDPDDPSGDRVMLAIQYATALVAVLAAGLLSLVR
jgi:hypothetical protein